MGAAHACDEFYTAPSLQDLIGYERNYPICRWTENELALHFRRSLAQVGAHTDCVGISVESGRPISLDSIPSSGDIQVFTSGILTTDELSDA
jgi:hypothetical protein